MSIRMIGLDTAKSVFQIHAVDAGGKAVLRRKLRRSEVLALITDMLGAFRISAEPSKTQQRTAAAVAVQE